MRWPTLHTLWVRPCGLLTKLQDELKELNLEIEKFNRRVKIMQKAPENIPTLLS